MNSSSALLSALREGNHDSVLAALYALDGTEESLEQGRARAVRTVEAFRREFPDTAETADAALFSGPGRTEIGGNHTDHQHGHVLCGSVDMDMLACAAPNGQNAIHILSEGYPALTVELDSLAPVEAERNTSAALVRGVAEQVRNLGYPVGGFDACVTSTVLSGSGLSSSAAYEVLMGNILNRLFCGGKLDAVQIAKIGQYAENVHFGKPCGLMDQMGSSVGGAVAIDFQDPAAPVVRKVEYDFTKSGHALCIVDTHASHADLTDDYADIPKEMCSVAKAHGVSVLRDLHEVMFRNTIPTLRKKCGDRAVLRAMHYYDDDRRARQEALALEMEDFGQFLKLVNASGLSSSLYLQNTWSPSNPRQQAIPMALAIGRELLDGTGAIRVHGGGFAGTIQAFVPVEKVQGFRNGLDNLLGAGSCHILHIRAAGGCVVAE